MAIPIRSVLHRLLPLCCLLPLLGLGGCAGMPRSGGWGGDATLTPGWQRVGDAALAAAKDPYTWVPAVSAAALQIGNLDNRIADWANKNTPVFGSRRSAADASDMLVEANLALYLGSGLAAPAPADGDWLGAKARGFAAGAAAIFATSGVTTGLKALSRRRRPLGTGRASFPSGHASFAGVTDRLTFETLGWYDMAPPLRTAAGAGLTGLALMTGWARVEAGKHHPADVLAGAALGNFFAVFFTKGFLDPATTHHVALGVSSEGDGLSLHVAFSY